MQNRKIAEYQKPCHNLTPWCYSELHLLYVFIVARDSAVFRVSGKLNKLGIKAKS